MELKSLETEVMRALTEVIDPETGLDIIRMDLIHGTEVTTQGSVSLGVPSLFSCLPHGVFVGQLHQKKA